MRVAEVFSKICRFFYQLFHIKFLHDVFHFIVGIMEHIYVKISKYYNILYVGIVGPIKTFAYQICVIGGTFWWSVKATNKNLFRPDLNFDPGCLKTSDFEVRATFA